MVSSYFHRVAPIYGRLGDRMVAGFVGVAGQLCIRFQHQTLTSPLFYICICMHVLLPHIKTILLIYLDIDIYR